MISAAWPGAEQVNRRRESQSLGGVSVLLLPLLRRYGPGWGEAQASTSLSNQGTRALVMWSSVHLQGRSANDRPCRLTAQPSRRWMAYGEGAEARAFRRASRQAPGARPVAFLKARLNAASESYPTSAPIAATLVPLWASRLAAICIRHWVR